MNGCQSPIQLSGRKSSRDSRRAVTKVKRSFVFCRLFCWTPTKKRSALDTLQREMMASSGSFFRWLRFSLKYPTSPVHLIYGAAILVEKEPAEGADGRMFGGQVGGRETKKKRGNVLRLGTSLIVGGHHKYLVGPMNGCCNRIQRRRQTNGRTGPNLTAPTRLLRPQLPGGGNWQQGK